MLWKFNFEIQDGGGRHLEFAILNQKITAEMDSPVLTTPEKM